MKSLRDVFIDQIIDLYSAEVQLMAVLPNMILATASPKLARSLEAYLHETKKQVARLERIAEIFDNELSGDICRGMQGLMREAGEIIEDDYASTNLRDAMIASIAQKAGHYEIAGYGNAIVLAGVLGREDAAEILAESLEEEKNADRGITRACQIEVFPTAELNPAL